MPPHQRALSTRRLPSETWAEKAARFWISQAHVTSDQTRQERGAASGGWLAAVDVSPTGTDGWKIPLELWFAVDGMRRTA